MVLPAAGVMAQAARSESNKALKVDRQRRATSDGGCKAALEEPAIYFDTLSSSCLLSGMKIWTAS